MKLSSGLPVEFQQKRIGIEGGNIPVEWPNANVRPIRLVAIQTAESFAGFRVLSVNSGNQAEGLTAGEAATHASAP